MSQPTTKHDAPDSAASRADWPTQPLAASPSSAAESRTATPRGNEADALAAGILDSVVVGVVRFDRHGTAVYFNAFAQRLLDFTGLATRAVALDSFQPYTIHSDGSACLPKDYPASRCLATGRPQGPATIGLRRADAKTVWLSVSAVPVFEPAGGQLTGAIATFVDISHSMEVEESLRQSEERYRILVEQAPDAIVVHHRGMIVYVNGAAVALWRGHSREQFIGRPILEYVHPRYHEAVNRRIAQIEGGGQVPPMDQVHLTVDGQRRRVEVTGMRCTYDGQPCVQAILRDVTARRHAERQVHRHREILRKFFNRIPLLVVMADSAGRIKMVNREFKRVLGWDDDQTIGQLLQHCFDDPQVRRQALEHMSQAPPGWTDTRVRARDGNSYVFAAAVIALSDGTRIGIGQDISKRKEAENILRRLKTELEERVQARTEELVRKNDQLKEQQQTLRQMIATHERYRQLLAYEIHDTFVQDVIGALMYLDLFYETRVDEGDARFESVETALALLREAVAGARRTISGLRPPIIDEQGVAAALDYLVSELNAQGMSVRLHHALGSQRLPSVVEAALFRIVQEALANVARHSGTQSAEVSLTQKGDRIHLSISDRGCGFDPQAVGPGHFGLRAITERARLLDGTADIRSQPGQGTAIAIDVPATPGDSLAEGPALGPPV